MPDVPPFGNPFVFAFACRRSQMRLRIHPSRTAAGRREQEPSCRTVTEKRRQPPPSPSSEVSRSLSDRTRVITTDIWNFNKATTYPPLFQSPAIQAGLARSPLPRREWVGMAQSANAAQLRANRQAVVCNDSKNRRGVKLYVAAFNNAAVDNGRGLSAAAERPLPVRETVHINSSTPWPPSDRRCRNRPEPFRSRRRSGTRSCPPSPAASGRHSSTHRRPTPSLRRRV